MRTMGTWNWRTAVGALLVTCAVSGCDKGAADAPPAAVTTVPPVVHATPPSPATTAPASSPAAAAPAGSEILVILGTRIDVVVDHTGFVPSTVKVRKGQTTTIVFTRTVKDTCADAVVFPELKVDKMLPLNKPVAVQIPVEEEHTFAFQCGMGMYKSKVVVQ